MAEAIGFREYGARVVRERLTLMLSHAPGVRLAEDIEALHDMRVASRRLRAALGMFAPAFPDPELKKFEREVKAVTDALGAARDLDVMIDTLRELEAELPEGERVGMDLFVSERVADRQKMQVDVVRALDRLDKQDLVATWDGIVARAAENAAKQAGADATATPSAAAMAPAAGA